MNKKMVPVMLALTSWTPSVSHKYIEDDENRKNMRRLYQVP